MADVFNQHEHVVLLEHEVAAYEALRHLQGTILPHLVDYGYMPGGGAFFIATARLRGSHPCPRQPTSSMQQAHAEQVCWRGCLVQVQEPGPRYYDDDQIIN